MNQDKIKLIKEPYLLYVGNAYPHKNLERLLEAFKIVIQIKPELNLVLVGKIDYFYKKLIELAKKLKINNKLVFVGQISDKKLLFLYKNGLIYVFPSLSEGFGLPGLEAMKNKLPVISSNKGPLPEIYGKAAIYFDPINIHKISKTILDVINNEKIRENMTKKGLIQVKKYSWQKCAQETLRIYESCL